jgi:hypothetical protein
MSTDDYDSWQETVNLLRSPEKARRLMDAVAHDNAGREPAAAGALLSRVIACTVVVHAGDHSRQRKIQPCAAAVADGRVDIVDVSS